MLLKKKEINAHVGARRAVPLRHGKAEWRQTTLCQRRCPPFATRQSASGNRPLATQRPIQLSRLRILSRSVRRSQGITIDDSTSVCADVDAAVLLRIARDVQQQAPLVLVVIDAHPARANVVGTEDPAHAIDHADEIERGEVGPGRGFPETESMNLLDAIEP